MKIKRITTAVVEANYDYTYTRIEVENGLYGTGESYFAPGLTVIIHELGELLIGRDPREIERLVQHMARKASGAGSVGGIVWNAISGIEAALYDLVGKYYGCPIYQLLGGKVRDSVRVYADSHAGANCESWSCLLQERKPGWLEALGLHHGDEEFYDPQAYGARAKEVVAKGFTALKFDLDSMVVMTGEELSRQLTNEEIERMIEVVRVTREAVGPNIDLAFDCHWRFRPADAIKIARGIVPYNPFWLEDPCPPENWQQIAAVKQAGGVPILTGENLVLRPAFLPLLQNGGVDIIAPDIQKCGGLKEGQRIAELAGLYGVGLAPHCIASPLGLMASAHVCSTVSNFTALEFHGQDVPFWNDLIAGDSIIQNGQVLLPDAPGVGVELNEESAREYTCRSETWFGESLS